MKILTVAVLLLVAVALQAQPVTYNMEPTHMVGADDWELPICGVLTMSQNASLLIVASVKDTTFYAVDPETGNYRNLNIPYIHNNRRIRQSFAMDNDCRWIVTSMREWSTDSTYTESYQIHDTQTNEVLADLDTLIKCDAVSAVVDRLTSRSMLFRATDLMVVADIGIAPSGEPWFDDELNRLYWPTPRELLVLDARTGEHVQSITVLAREYTVRRPQGSDWLYVFSQEEGLHVNQNWVEALQLDSRKRVNFADYVWFGGGGQPENVNPLVSLGVVHMRATDRGHANPIWEFKAEERLSQVVVDPEYLYQGEPASKVRCIAPDKSAMFHCWVTRSGDSCRLLRSSLVPVVTSVEDQLHRQPDRLMVTHHRGHIEIDWSERDGVQRTVNIELYSVHGARIDIGSVGTTELPARVSTADIPSGPLLLVLRTHEGSQVELIMHTR